MLGIYSGGVSDHLLSLFYFHFYLYCFRFAFISLSLSDIYQCTWPQYVRPLSVSFDSFFSFTLNCFYRHCFFYFYMYCCTLNGYMVLIFLAASCCASFTLFIVTFTFTFTFLLVPFTFQLTLTFKYISERLPGGHIPRGPLLRLFHIYHCHFHFYFFLVPFTFQLTFKIHFWKVTW